MQMETVRCPNCGAPLEVEKASDVVRCEYCRAQSTRSNDAADNIAADGPRLLETLSVEITADLGVGLLSSGTPVPVTRTEVFATSRDDQESFDVKLCAGNAERPADNRPLGCFSVPLIARGPRGTVRAGVTLFVAADGALRISVKEHGVDDPVTQDGCELAVGR